MGPLSDAAALPVELVCEVLEYLPVKGLWTAARVSRQFYAAAWHAGPCIHRSIVWQEDSGHADQLEVFKDVLEHARHKDVLRISLTLTCFFPRQFGPNRREVSFFQPGADEIFPVISAALPFLVFLSIRIPDHFRPQLDSTLRSPAPRLRTLEISRDWYSIPCTVPIPRDLFGGSAPLLRTLKLRTVTLPDAAVPAFRSVSQAALNYENVFPHINFRAQLPGLIDLDLEFAITVDVHAALPDYSDLSGLPLRILVIEDGSEERNVTPLLDAVGRSMDLSAIPVVLAVGQTIKSDTHGWPEDKAELSMRIHYFPDDPYEEDYLVISVSPDHRRWRRLYQLKYWDTDMPVPLRALPDFSTRLVGLRIDSYLVPSLLELALRLTALRALHIDLHGHDFERTWLQPLDYDDTLDLSSVSATLLHPQLENLTLFALRQPLKALDSRRIAFLAHDLGGRPALALVGVEFAEPVESALLAQTVSAIHQYPFAGRGSREDYDGGLWDVELFNGNLGDFCYRLATACHALRCNPESILCLGYYNRNFCIASVQFYLFSPSKRAGTHVCAFPGAGPFTLAL